MRTLLIAGILISCAAAQIPTEPPVLVQLTRLPGGDTGASRPYSRVRAAVNVFGLRSVTGLAETWLVEAHDSFASIEDLDKALNAVAQAGCAISQDDLLAPARISAKSRASADPVSTA